MQIPKYDERNASQKADDPWMTLAQAVRWVAWLDRPERVYGSDDLGDGVWTDHGDLDEQDRLVYLDGAEKVRIALTSGRLEAWGQTGYEEPQLFPKARWSAHFGAPISWVEFYRPYDRIVVEREKVAELWPVEGGTKLEAPRCFTQEDRRAWMDEQPIMDADAAHKLFKDHPRFDGTKQAEFRVEWKCVRRTSRGRPRIKS